LNCSGMVKEGRAGRAVMGTPLFCSPETFTTISA
jgi:hypothetical protein